MAGNGWAAALLLAVVLAGCGSPAATPQRADGEALPPPPPGKGAIAGLLIDDRYRPVPDAQVVLFPLGLQTATDGSGQFSFLDLDPGAYELRATADAHEAPPFAVDVREGEYAEAEVMARRVLGFGSDIITVQTTVFISCAASALVVTVIWDCLPDGPDSYAFYDLARFSSYGANATYFVSEFLASQSDGYMVGWSCDGDGLDHQEFEGTYTHMVLPYGNRTTSGYNGKVWRNDCDVIQATMFYIGSAGPITKGAGFGWGVGARFAVKVSYLDSLFLGPPQVDVEAYGPMRPKE